MCDEVFETVGSWASSAADSIGGALGGIGDAIGAVGDWAVSTPSSYGDAPMAGMWESATSAVSDVAGTNTGGSWLDSLVPLGDAPAASGIAKNSSIIGDFGDSLANRAKTVDWTGAGLKLGAQALGSMASAQGSKEMSSYLNDVKALEQQAQKFNIGSATSKNAIAGQLATDGTAINPAQYAQNQANSTKNRDAAAWSETEARMRASGFDENAITAERNRAGLVSSQNQGTAYDSGQATGTQLRNSTLGTAGSLYGQVATPSAGLASAYSAQNNADATAQKNWGNAIEQAFGLVNKTSKDGTAT